MSHTFVNPTVVASEALRQLENSLVMGNLVHRAYEEEWSKSHNGYKPGSSVTLKCPVYFRVKDGATLDAVDLLERSTTFTLAYRKHIAWAVTAQEMTYSIDKFSERFITPAMQALANYVDSTLLSLYKGIPNQVGTPGSTPNQYLTFALANAKLSEHAVPESNRYCVIDPQCQAYMADNLKGLFNPSMVGPAIERAKLPSLAGMEMFVSQNVNTHTCGTAAGLTTVLMDETSSEGAQTVLIDTNGSWTLTLTEGDIFTIASVYGVNPISGDSTGSLRQFVCYDAGGGSHHTDNGNDATIKCIPGTDPYKIYSASAAETYLPYQTVDALPAENATVTVAGTASLSHKVNLAFHKDALGLCMVPLAMPASVSWGATKSYKGYSIRVIRDYDVTNDQEYVRFDCLFGVKCLNPFMACRIAG